MLDGALALSRQSPPGCTTASYTNVRSHLQRPELRCVHVSRRLAAAQASRARLSCVRRKASRPDGRSVFASVTGSTRLGIVRTGVLAAALLLALATGGCAGTSAGRAASTEAAVDTAPSTGTFPAAASAPTAPSPIYTASATRRCLLTRNAQMTPIRARTGRLRQLADLAQRTSFEVRLRGRTIGLAFGNTRLLADLLVVPNDPYRIETRGNALLMYLPAARAQAAVVRACLRR